MQNSDYVDWVCQTNLDLKLLCTLTSIGWICVVLCVMYLHNHNCMALIASSLAMLLGREHLVIIIIKDAI